MSRSGPRRWLTWWWWLLLKITTFDTISILNLIKVNLNCNTFTYMIYENVPKFSKANSHFSHLNERRTIKLTFNKSHTNLLYTTVWSLRIEFSLFTVPFSHRLLEADKLISRIPHRLILYHRLILEDWIWCFHLVFTWVVRSRRIDIRGLGKLGSSLDRLIFNRTLGMSSQAISTVIVQEVGGLKSVNPCDFAGIVRWAYLQKLRT